MKEKTVQTDNTTPLLQISSIQSNRVLGRTQVFFFFFFTAFIYISPKKNSREMDYVVHFRWYLIWQLMM